MLLGAGNAAKGRERPPGNEAKGVGHSDLKDTRINTNEKRSFEAAAFGPSLRALPFGSRVKRQKLR